MLTMTPQARALLAFTAAVLLVTGQLNRIAFAFYGVFGDALPEDETGQFVLSSLTVVLAAGVLWFAHATASAGDAAGWDVNLAQAARVLALVGVVIAVLATISVLTNDQAFFGSFSLGF